MRVGHLGILLASAWTAAAGLAMVALQRHPPLVVQMGSRGLFASSLLEIGLIWLGGLGLILAISGGKKGRRLALALVAAVLLAALAIGLGARPPAEGVEGALGPENRTTLLVAVDGMSWSVILPMVRRGELPTIRRLMAEGSYGVLHSLRSERPSNGQSGYWSPVVWTSLATGVGPERHGIDDFEVRSEQGKPRLAKSTHRRVPAFWNLFSGLGYRVGVVGWWASWPAEEIDGYIVSSHLGLRGQRRGGRVGREIGQPRMELYGLTHPESYAQELSAVLPSVEAIEELARERIFPFEHYPLTTDRDRRIIYSVLWQDQAYFQVARSLIRAQPLTLYSVYFEGADVLSHHFWRYRTRPEAIGDWEKLLMPEGYRGHARVIDNYYRILDEYLGSLLEELPRNATVIVASDHGFHDDPRHPRNADHSPFGVLIARGPGISPSKNLNLRTWSSTWEMIGPRTTVLDVLPTLLYLHGLPVSRELEGAVLEGLISSEYRSRHDIERVPSYKALGEPPSTADDVDDATQEEYEKRLRSLGYVN